MHCAKNDSQIKLFLSRGHSINYQCPLGQTALHKSVISKNYDLCRDLLINGANPNLKNYLGESPIFYADEKSTEILLEYGGPIVLNLVNDKGQTAISINKSVEKYVSNLTRLV